MSIMTLPLHVLFTAFPVIGLFRRGSSACDNPQRPANAGRDQYDGRVDGGVAHDLRAMRAEVRVLAPSVPLLWGQPACGNLNPGLGSHTPTSGLAVVTRNIAAWGVWGDAE